jgi:rare lipoprotein A
MIRRSARLPILFCGLLLVGCIRPSDPVTAMPPPVASAPEPVEQPVFEQVGRASWYGAWHAGRKTASGERFDPKELTAAHRTLPLGTEARVTNLENGRTVEVTVNDRGPYKDGRVLDLSQRAAEELGMKEKGLARVKIEVVESAEPKGKTQTATVTD